MNKQYYIYITTNLVNNKKYIGQHFGQTDDDYLGSGIILNRAIQKYGKENFKKEILEIVNSKQEANTKEKYYINVYQAIENPNFYNIADGGQGGYVTKGYTLEDRQSVNKKISQSLTGEKHPMYGKHHTEETKEKIKKSLQQYWTLEKRNQRSKKYTGEGNPMYGKHHTEETKEKIRQNKDTSYMQTEQYKKKMSLATSGEKNGNYGNKGQKAKNGRHVFMYDENYNLIKEFNTKRLVLQFLNVSSAQTLNKAIREKKLYRGYYWSQI